MNWSCRLFCLLLASAASLGAAANLVVTGGVLRDAAGAALADLPPGSLVALVASTQDNVFQPPPAGASLQPGTTWGGDDVVLAVFPVGSSNTGLSGGFVGAVPLDYAALGIPTLGAGDQLMLYWFPAAGLNGSQILANAPYGSYRTGGILNRSSTGWVAPDDSTGATVELNFLTSAVGGEADNELAKAVHTVSGAAFIAVTVQTSPVGRPFKVDDTVYTVSQTFNWVPGSTHTIDTGSVQGGATGVQYSWTAWSDGGAMSHAVSPTVGAVYIASFSTQYLLTMSAGAGGTVSPASGWFGAGQAVAITASGNSGASFAGWAGTGAGSYSGPNSQASVTMEGPINQTAAFGGGDIAGQAFITGTIPGTLRNDFPGWVGMQFVVGSQPLSVSQLGRIVAPGNNGTHPVKLVRASDGSDVPGAAVTIATSGGTQGQFQYASLPAPVVLAAGTTYWLLSLEAGGGDLWYDSNATVMTTGDAVDNGYVWSTGPNTWGTASALNRGVVAVNFKYVIATSGTAFVTNLVPGTLRNDFTGWVGIQIQVGASPVSVSELGRIVLAGNTGTHAVKLVRAGDGLDVPGGGATIATTGGTPGQFSYARLPSPITLAAGATYWLVSQETGGGDLWYHSDASVTTTGVAAANGYVWSTGPGTWATTLASNRGVVAVNFKYAVTPSNTAFVTNLVPGTLRDDFPGWVGIQVTVGASPINVAELGRIVAPGNTGTHAVKLVRASDGLDVPGGAVLVDTSGGTTGQFRYARLNAPVTLAAGATYWLVSEEVWGGDRWYDSDATVTTTGVATNSGFVWATGPGTWGTSLTPNRGVVTVNFKY